MLSQGVRDSLRSISQDQIASCCKRRCTGLPWVGGQVFERTVRQTSVGLCESEAQARGVQALRLPSIHPELCDGPAFTAQPKQMGTNFCSPELVSGTQQWQASTCKLQGMPLSLEQQHEADTFELKGSASTAGQQRAGVGSEPKGKQAPKGSNKEESDRRHPRLQSLLLRLIDDFLFITPSRTAAEALVNKLLKGKLLKHCISSKWTPACWAWVSLCVSIGIESALHR